MTSNGHHGFTLLELITTLAVATVLLAIAVPSYQTVTSRNGLAAAVNDLVGDINYARSEAATRGNSVYICASTSHKTCRNDGIWTGGWIIYAPLVDTGSHRPSPDNLLRVHDKLGSIVQLTSNVSRPLSFNASGFPMGGRTFTATDRAGNLARRIVVAFSGRVRTEGSP